MLSRRGGSKCRDLKKVCRWYGDLITIYIPRVKNVLWRNWNWLTTTSMGPGIWGKKSSEVKSPAFDHLPPLRVNIDEVHYEALSLKMSTVQYMSIFLTVYSLTAFSMFTPTLWSTHATLYRARRIPTKTYFISAICWEYSNRKAIAPPKISGLLLITRQRKWNLLA